jgi:hypothetical protein
MSNSASVRVPDMPDAYDAYFLAGYLRSTLRSAGVITVADWTKAIQAAAAEAARRQEQP